LTPNLGSTPYAVAIFSQNDINSESCSKKDDTLLYEKRYKIIDGFATDRRECVLYRNNVSRAISAIVAWSILGPSRPRDTVGWMGGWLLKP
jgi:hypothetical protein